MDRVSQIVLFLVVLFLSIPIHEFSHAWAAYQLGDPTARNLGRLTLNPIKHFDPIGALMIVMMSITGVGLGWGKPVPVNPNNLNVRPRVGMGLTAAAGPFSNLVLAALCAIPLRLVPSSLPQPVWLFLQWMVVINVGLAVFNLLPLPPLDGFSVIQGIIGTFRTRWAFEWGSRLDKLGAYGPFLLIGLLAVGWFGGMNILGTILGVPRDAIVGLLLGY